MLTVMLTLRAQQRPVLEYLTAACQAVRHGLPAPSLLPNLSLFRSYAVLESRNKRHRISDER
jgi:hypothetical protein